MTTAKFRKRYSATRELTVCERIDPEQTGLKASIYVHLTFKHGGGVRVSMTYKQADDGTLDRLLLATSDAINRMLEDAEG